MQQGSSNGDFDAALTAGVAIFNSGQYHSAHDAWEREWLSLESGTPNERFLHGLIQYTAAVHHAAHDNHVGARGLATSARTYLAGLSSTHRNVAITPLRHGLAAIALDPTVVHRHGPPPLLVNGVALLPEDLTTAGLQSAASVLAAEDDDIPIELIDDAIQYITIDPIRHLLIDLIRHSERRATILPRLRAHVERETAKDADVSGLFNGDSSG